MPSPLSRQESGCPTPKENKVAVCQREESVLYLLYKEKKLTLSLVKKVEWLSLSYVRRRGCFSAETRESPSTFEREETDLGLSSAKRVVLSFLKRRRWPYVDGDRVAPIYFIQEKKLTLS